jgi:hypothetical protein
MQKSEYNDDVDMSFSAAGDWRHDIWLPQGAQMTEIHLRVYSFTFPENIYHITWGLVRLDGNQQLIPIHASKAGDADRNDAVRLAIDITYYSET